MMPNSVVFPTVGAQWNGFTMSSANHTLAR